MPDTPYSIVTISAMSLLFYGISLALVKLGIFSAYGQRKFWNFLLLISISIAGGIGLLLAVTINFKINLSLTDTLLVWHVDFGTALVMMAFFHFSWHLKYYKSILLSLNSAGKIQVSNSARSASIQNNYKPGFNVKRLAFSLGFTSMATQLILIREFLSVFNGNELVIGLVLANWMLLTGLGAMLNRKNSKPSGLVVIMSGLFTLSAIPVLTLFLLDWSRNIVLPAGSLPSILQICLATCLLLAPFCLYSGWLFIAVSRYLSDALNENAISLTYGWETLGGIAAGILCSMILVFLFAPFQNLAIILILNCIILFLRQWKVIYRFRKKYLLYPAVAAVMALATFISNLDGTALQFLFPGQELVSFKDTPYGKLVVTQNAGQLNFFENNNLLFTTNNTTVNEETVHYALLQRPIRGNVLLLGGSISGVAGECLKYPLKRLECFETDPQISIMGKKFRRIPSDTRFSLQTGDARILLRDILSVKQNLLSQSGNVQKVADSLSYDAVIIDLPGPSTLRMNRYYTLGFFTTLKRLLSPQGIITLSLLPTADYVGSSALMIQSTMYQTLKAVFNNVLVIPGDKNYFLASDGALTAAVSSLGAKAGIGTEYVNEYYLDDVSLAERSSSVMKRISVDAPINCDFEPVGCFRELDYWLSYPGNTGFYFLFLPVCILLLIAGIRAGGITVALFTAGFGSFSLEIILILTFQLIYGYVYLMTGIFITLFMAGLATGILLAKRNSANLTYNNLLKMQAYSLAIILISLFCLYLFQKIQLPVVFMHLLFSLLIIFMAIVTGAQFHMASVLKTGQVQQVAASSYSADLAGSATGALAVNAVIIPFWGLSGALFLLAGVYALAISIMMIKKRS